RPPQARLPRAAPRVAARSARRVGRASAPSRRDPSPRLVPARRDRSHVDAPSRRYARPQLRSVVLAQPGGVVRAVDRTERGMTAICGMIGDWARHPDAGAHLDAMLRALAIRGGGKRATWNDGECLLGIAGRDRVIDRDNFAVVCDGMLFD